MVEIRTLREELFQLNKKNLELLGNQDSVERQKLNMEAKDVLKENMLSLMRAKLKTSESNQA